MALDWHTTEPTRWGSGWLSGLLGAILGVVALYVAWRWVARRRFLNSLRTSRIAVAELSDMIRRGEAPIVLDVRSRTHRSLDPRMIPGARAVDLDDLEAALPQIPSGRDVVVYCACPNDATAVKVATLLMSRGIGRVRPLAGGFDAWVSAGGIPGTGS